MLRLTITYTIGENEEYFKLYTDTLHFESKLRQVEQYLADNHARDIIYMYEALEEGEQSEFYSSADTGIEDDQN